MDDRCKKNRRNVGMRIKEIRETQGLSQRKLALMIGMDHATISKIECGTYNPSLDKLSIIAAGLDVGLLELFQVPQSKANTTEYTILNA